MTIGIGPKVPITGDVRDIRWWMETVRNLIGKIDAEVAAAHNEIEGNHSLLRRGGVVGNRDSSGSVVSVDTADADDTYGTPERNLINELKADLNTLVADHNRTVSDLNDLKEVLRAAGLIDG